MKNPPMFLQIYNSHERSNQKSPQFPWVGFRGILQENPENIFLFRVETMVCYRCTSKSLWSSVVLSNFLCLPGSWPANPHPKPCLATCKSSDSLGYFMGDRMGIPWRYHGDIMGILWGYNGIYIYFSHSAFCDCRRGSSYLNSKTQPFSPRNLCPAHL